MKTLEELSPDTTDAFDTTTPYDRFDDPGLDPEDVMYLPFEPKVPCVGLPTRACVARWDDGAPIYAAQRCPDVCWRYRSDVEDGYQIRVLIKGQTKTSPVNQNNAVELAELFPHHIYYYDFESAEG